MNAISETQNYYIHKKFGKRIVLNAEPLPANGQPAPTVDAANNASSFKHITADDAEEEFIAISATKEAETAKAPPKVKSVRRISLNNARGGEKPQLQYGAIKRRLRPKSEDSRYKDIMESLKQRV